MAIKRIAVIIDVAVSAFHRNTHTGIQRACKETGLEAVYIGVGGLNVHHEEYRLSKDLLSLISAKEFDGVLVASSSLINQGGTAILEDFMRSLGDLPLISIGPSVIGEPNLIFDNEAGMRAMAEHLVHDHGYRDIACLSGPFSNREAIIRLEALKDVMSQAGLSLDSDHLFEGDFLPRSGEKAVHYFLEEKKIRPQVIVCANDMMALGVYSALMHRGISMPWDIAVTGCDDLQSSRAQFHHFTTIRQSFELLAYDAVHHLACVIEGKEAKPIQLLEPHLCIRRSCGCRYENRYAREAATYASCTEIEDSGEDLEFSFDSGNKTDIFRQLSLNVHRMMREKIPVQELVSRIQVLRLCPAPATGGDIEKRALSSELYTLLLEELAQIDFTDFWEMRNINFAMERICSFIESTVSENLNFQSAMDHFGELLFSIKGECIYLIRFDNREDILQGASFLTALSYRIPWETVGPGSWFPPRGAGNLVVNIMLNNDRHFGYLITDANIPSVDLHEFLYKRFSSIIRNYVIMFMSHEINNKLISEMQVRKQAEKRLKEALSKVERMSTEDDLTGLKNRRGFFSMAEQQIRYMKREKQEFLILFIDLDGLKVINDRYGHTEGDLAIKGTSRILLSALRDSDIIARMGGDEFTALVSNVSPLCFHKIKDRILKTCEEMNDEMGKEWKISMSVGHCHSEGTESLSLEEMLEKADAELYREKQIKKRKRALEGGGSPPVA